MRQGGFTLVEVLIGAFLTVIIFMGIFGGLRLALEVIGQSRARVAATELANQRLEQMRALTYADVGTVGGFPEGTLAANDAQTVNGIDYTIVTRVDYVIDTTDGTAPPADDCPNDYKKVEVDVSWSEKNSGSVVLVTDRVPDNIAQECADGGGILDVTVFDAFGVLVPSPFIEVVDPDTLDVIKTATPDTGQHLFSVPADSYRVHISKNGFTSTRSYGTAEVATPTKPHPIVIEDTITHISFAIDVVSSFVVSTLAAGGLDLFADSFTDSSQINAFSQTELAGGDVRLLDQGGGTYPASGTVTSVDVIPATIVNWDEVTFSDTTPPTTTITYQVLHNTGTSWDPIPDVDLPGNATGFNVSPIDISNLNVPAYPTLRLRGNLATADSNITPLIHSWQLSWRTTSATPIPNTSFDVRGEKLIGTDVSEQSVYLYDQTAVTDGTGTITLNNLEWDNYTFSIDPASGLDLDSITPNPQPIGLNPNTSVPISLFLSSDNSFLGVVHDIDTALPIFSASIRLQEGTYDNTLYTDTEGQVYFAPLNTANYTVEIQAAGYTTFNGSVPVSGDTSQLFQLQRVE